MITIRVFVSFMTVLFILGPLHEAEAQSGSFVEYENRDSALNSGLTVATNMFRNMMGNVMSSNGSPIYDMVKNGSTLGINVLSGLVKVDRVREPDKPRGLMVRVFGVPVYSRGVGAAYPLPSDSGSRMKPAAKPASGGDGRGGREEEDELPLDPLVR